MKPDSFTLKFITDAASTFHGTCGYDEWVHEGSDVSMKGGWMS